MNSVVCTCGRVIAVRPEMAGKKIKCLACNTLVPVPAASAAAAPSVVPAPAPEAAKPSAAVSAAPPLPVASPAAARTVIQKESSGSWKILAAAGMVIGIVSLVFNIYLSARKSGPEKADVRSPGDGQEIERLKTLSQDRAKEIETLRELLAKGNDPTRYEKYFQQIQELQEQLRKSNEALESERTQTQRLNDRIRELGNAPPAVVPPPQGPKVDSTVGAKPGPDKALSELVERCMPSVVVVRTDVGAGAGFFVTEDGFLVTNYHVVARSRSITVNHMLVDGQKRVPTQGVAQVYALDVKNDLALLKLNASLVKVEMVDLDLPASSKVGDGVFAIGNPGMGNRLLEMSVSNGIVSSLTRQIEERRFLQTTTAINPGNSGGPLFNMSGKVVGVVTAKANDKENIGFAVPADLVKNLLDNREDSFRVKGTLADWETKNGLQDKIKYDPARAIQLEGSITRFLLDEDGDRILAIEYESNSLLQISLSERKVTKKVYTGSEPSALAAIPGQSKQVMVANRASRNLVKIDLEKNAVTETVPLAFSPQTLQLTRRHYWSLEAEGRVHAVSATDKKEIPLSMLMCSGIAYDQKRDHLYAAAGGAVVDWDAAKALPMMRELAALKPEQFQQRQQLTNEMNKVMKQVPLPSNSFGNWTIGFGMLLDEKNNRLYLHRAVLKPDKLDAPLGVFKANPYSMSADPSVRAFMNRYPFLDEILAVSPDGKWAATGTHLFSTTTFTVHKEIPIPTPSVAFSKDSKGLYYHDWVNRVIAVIDVESK